MTGTQFRGLLHGGAALEIRFRAAPSQQLLQVGQPLLEGAALGLEADRERLADVGLVIHNKDAQASRLGFRVQSSEFRVQGSEFRVQCSEFGVPSLEFGVWSLEFGVWSLEFGVWSLEFGVQSSELRVQSSELGVQGSGFRVLGPES